MAIGKADGGVMPARPHARGSARHFVGLPPEEVAVTYTPFPIHQRLKNGPGTRLCSVSALAKVILTRSARAAGLWLPPLRTRCLPAAMPAAVSASQLAVVYKARARPTTGPYVVLPPTASPASTSARMFRRSADLRRSWTLSSECFAPTRHQHLPKVARAPKQPSEARRHTCPRVLSVPLRAGLHHGAERHTSGVRRHS